MYTLFPAIVAANIDGRVHNVRYRQEQFHRLQTAILQHLEEIIDSISQDYGRSAQEVQAEICLALKDIRTHYLSLDAARAVQDEYSVANGRDNASMKRGAGIVYIVLTRHTLFYSVVPFLWRHGIDGHYPPNHPDRFSWGQEELLEPRTTSRQLSYPHVTILAYQPCDGAEDSILLGELSILIAAIKGCSTQLRVEEEADRECLDEMKPWQLERYGLDLPRK